MSQDNLDHIIDSNLHLNIDIKLPHPVHHHHFKSISPRSELYPSDHVILDGDAQPNIYSKAINLSSPAQEYADPVREAHIVRGGFGHGKGN